MNSKPVVAVAMSGGVDSSVAAALLVEQGYSVMGMMLRLWSEPDAERSNRCCTPDAVALARQVASILGIPFYVLDAKQFFFDQVVKPFIDDYSRNLTPNPCIACNRQVRWGFLLNHALAAGADYLATGHYVRIQKSQGQIQLLRGVDTHKDQSYVLHILNQSQLSHALFPLGEYRKPEVRQLAQQFNLPVAEKPDSQDLCFTGADRDYRHFLTRYAPQAIIPGNIVDSQGNIIGKHTGLPFYTIGQRKGLGVAATQPLYVIKKDYESNTITAGPREKPGELRFSAKQVNWVAGTPPGLTFPAQIKIRYKANDLACSVELVENEHIIIQLEKTVQDITPGQAAVLYNGDVCLGGGIISNLET